MHRRTVVDLDRPRAAPAHREVETSFDSIFSAGRWAARLEQEARSRAWLCPPRRHKHASGPLRRLAATRSARHLPPACVRMAFACSAAHGGVVTATRPVAFSGRLRGVLVGARGTWAGVVLGGHRTAVLAKLPQAGQPCCGNLSKSTVGQRPARQSIRRELTRCLPISPCPCAFAQLVTGRVHRG